MWYSIFEHIWSDIGIWFTFIHIYLCHYLFCRCIWDCVWTLLYLIRINCYRFTLCKLWNILVILLWSQTEYLNINNSLKHKMTDGMNAEFQANLDLYQIRNNWCAVLSKFILLPLCHSATEYIDHFSNKSSSQCSTINKSVFSAG